MGGESREELTIGYSSTKQKSSKCVILLGLVAGAMTIATIVLAVLYGLDVGSTTSDSNTVITTTPAKPPVETTPSKPPVETTPSDTQPEICQTQACITAASRILNAMNTDAKPCEDFFEYACGTWNRDHIIADDQSSVSTFNGLRDDVSKVLKRVLETSSTNDRPSIKKAKDFYASCMDTSTIDGLGVQPVKNLIMAMGGWPVIGDAFDASTFVFEDVLATFRSRFATYALVSSWVSADDKDSQANIFQIDQPSLGMPNRDYYLNEETRNNTEPAYKKYMTDFMTMIAGPAADAAKISTVVEDIIQLETDLATSMAPSSERRDSLAIYNNMSLLSLGTEINGDIDWVAYINKLLEITTETVDETENVVVYATEYLKNVSSIVAGRWELVQNYLVWRVLKDRTSYMSADLRATRGPYTQATSGTTAEEARWMTCSDNANSYFEMPVGSLFVSDVFPEENKAVTSQMVEDIRTVFKELLPANDWMDQQTKDAAAEKADQISPFIAYPDYIVDENDPKMDDDYAAYNVDVATYFENIQSLSLASTTESFSNLRKPVAFDEWITGPAIVNAFYSPTRNSISFPAGILQPPFYDAGQPNSMNYGGIGMVIGHEITHGFDDSGAQYDGQGNLNNWWTASSKTNFDDRARCMSDQYSAISWDTAGGNNIDGNLTLGENIADNGGLRETYNAYKKWQEANPGGDLRLPGLGSFTQEQLFFIGYAQVWCGTYTPEYAVRLLKTDPHSPGIFRVQVPSQNFDAFGEAFSCTQGNDFMYPQPEDTCRVW